MLGDKLMTRRQLFFLILFGIGCAVLMVEVAGRALRLMPVPPPDSFYALREQVGVVPEPYQYITYSSPGEFNNFVQFNYRSLRDIDHEYEATEQPRVMFLGDSFTAGLQVPLGQTYTGQLRNLLAADVINAGFNNWGTDQQYMFYEVEGHKYQSDVVVLQIFLGNDVANNGNRVFEDFVLDTGRTVSAPPRVHTRARFSLDESGSLQYHPPGNVVPSNFDRVNSIRQFLTQYSFTYNLIQRFREAQNAPSPDVIYDHTSIDPEFIFMEWYGFSPEAETNDQWQTAQTITFELIRELRQSVEAHGAQFAVLLVESHYVYDPPRWDEITSFFNLPDEWQPSRLGEVFQTFLDDEGIPYLNPIEAFLAYEASTGAKMLYDLDSHWTPDGNCVIAVELHNWLVAEDYIESQVEAPIDALTYCPDNN